MGFPEMGERLWQKMRISEREIFLAQLAEATHRKPEWWDGMTSEAIARTSCFDDVPGDLRGTLMLAMTEEGFSIKKLTETWAEIQKRIREMP